MLHRNTHTNNVSHDIYLVYQKGRQVEFLGFEWPRIMTFEYRIKANSDYISYEHHPKGRICDARKNWFITSYLLPMCHLALS